MTIHVSQHLARLIEDAVLAGAYDREDDVIRDALIRLRQALETTAASTEQGGEPVLQAKPLTEQTLQRHLMEIGLVDQSPETSFKSVDGDTPVVDDEGGIISEVVIRERLIEWLVGFLPGGAGETERIA